MVMLVAAPARRSLSHAMMAGWGSGTIGPLVVAISMNSLLLRYLTDVVGIGAGLAATMIAVSKIYDTVFDPVMGHMSDRTRSRAGRRRPYILAGGALLALSVVALFSIPVFASPFAQGAYLGGVLLLYATGYSMFSVPYMAMPAEMTADYNERTLLISYRVYATGAAQILATTAGPLLIVWFGGGARGHVGMALVMSVIVILSALLCFGATRDAPFSHQDLVRLPFAAQIRTIAGNRPFVILMSVKLLTLTAIGAQSMFAFFFTRILGASYVLLSAYFLTFAIGMIVSQPAWLWLSARIGKHRTFMLALALFCPTSFSWLLVVHGEPAATILLRGILLGLFSGGCLLMGQSMLPDTIEYDTLATGLHREGIFAGFYTTTEKLSGAIGIAAVGALLSAAGYVSSAGPAVVEPASALRAISWIVAGIPGGISLITIPVLFFYPLSQPLLERLRAAGPAR